MASTKVSCKIDKHEGKGIEYYPLFIKDCTDEKEVHENAKRYMLTTFPNWSLYEIEIVKTL
ncbi:MAG: hypothetical protein JXA77_11305 [Bacteroidales bacterium]|nr:hypothetical protein [Bacteroidales bacterium]